MACLELVSGCVFVSGMTGALDMVSCMAVSMHVDTGPLILERARLTDSLRTWQIEQAQCQLLASQGAPAASGSRRRVQKTACLQLTWLLETETCSFFQETETCSFLKETETCSFFDGDRD